MFTGIKTLHFMILYDSHRVYFLVKSASIFVEL